MVTKLVLQELVKIFTFHNYDYLVNENLSDKIDPRKRKMENDTTSLVNLLFGAQNGDQTAIRR